MALAALADWLAALAALAGWLAALAALACLLAALVAGGLAGCSGRLLWQAAGCWLLAGFSGSFQRQLSTNFFADQIHWLFPQNLEYQIY